MFSMAMWMAALVAPVQIVVGDQHGLNTLEHQPAKILAMEGYYQAYPDGAPWHLFGMPDDEAETVRFAVSTPQMGSLAASCHDLNAPMPGLDALPQADRPPVGDPVLVVPGHGRPRLPDGRCSACGACSRGCAGGSTTGAGCTASPWSWGRAGFVAVIAGWVTTEVGRQPWVIYGLLRTEDAVSPIAAPGVTGSLIAFVIVYFTVFAAGTLYILRLMAQPPRPRRARRPRRRSAAPASRRRRRSSAMARRRSGQDRGGGGMMRPPRSSPVRKGGPPRSCVVEGLLARVWSMPLHQACGAGPPPRKPGRIG